MSALPLCLALCLPMQGPGFEIRIDRPIPELQVGKEFEQELRRPVSASWESVGLRGVCRRVSEDRNISILLDRRLDPSREIAIDVSYQPVLKVLEQVAAAVDALPTWARTEVPPVFARWCVCVETSCTDRN